MVTKDMPIIEVLRAVPEAREILAGLGMGCIGCMGSAQETLETGARLHGIDINALLRELNKAAQKN